MSDISLGERLNRVLIGLMLIDEGPVIDYSKERINSGTGGIHAHHIANTTSATATGNTSVVNRPARPPHILWAERFQWMIEAAEAYLDAEQHSKPTRMPGRTTGAGIRLSAHIQDYVGQPAEFVACMEGCSTELVYDERRKLHVHMNDGTPYERGESPVTPPVEYILEGLTYTPNDNIVGLNPYPQEG